MLYYSKFPWVELLILTAILLVAAFLMSGCALVDVRITKPDGTTIAAQGVSFLKDHGLEGMSYERESSEKGKGLVSPRSVSDSGKFQMNGYSSQARVELILKLLEAAK